MAPGLSSEEAALGSLDWAEGLDVCGQGIPIEGWLGSRQPEPPLKSKSLEAKGPHFHG